MHSFGVLAKRNCNYVKVVQFRSFDDFVKLNKRSDKGGDETAINRDRILMKTTN